MASANALYFKLTDGITIDESTAKAGNITAQVGGDTSSNVSSLVVGSYGEFGATCDVSGTAPTITAGMKGSGIGEIEIKEGIPGSLVQDRTVDLTLPTNVTWSQIPSVSSSSSTNMGSLAFTNLDSATGANWTPVGTSGQEIESTITGTTTGQTTGADIILDNMEVTPAVDFSGPVTVTVSGSEGITGTLTLANVAAGVTAAAASTPTVGIGTGNQTLGDITITEKAAGNLQSTVTTGLISTALLPPPTALHRTWA